jgi:tRNA uridine 5-carboxymethylaminomethyl modification enzyme
MYRRAVRTLLEEHASLRCIQGTVARLILDEAGTRVHGVETLEGRRFGASAVVITTGTFLRGRIHIGTTTRISGGRAGEASSIDLAEQLQNAGLTVARFKTGTPPRIDGRSVDFVGLERQESELAHFGYSWSHFWARSLDTRPPTDRYRPVGMQHELPSRAVMLEQQPCWITFLE